MAPEDAQRLAELFRPGGTFCARMPPWPAMAVVALEARQSFRRTLIVVTDGPVTMERMAGDLASLSRGFKREEEVYVFPALDQASPQHIGDRLRALHAATGHPLIVTCVQALMQPAVAPAAIRQQTLSIKTGEDHDPAGILHLLETGGYNFDAEVLQPAQASWRGGILDIWPPGSDWPVRIEFFGNTIDSIRTFDPVAQRSRELLAATEIAPARENATHAFADHVNGDAQWMWVDRESIDHHRELYLASTGEEATLRSHHPDQIAGSHLVFALAPEDDETMCAFAFEPLAGIPDAPGGSIPLDHIAAQRLRFLRALFALAGDGWSLQIYFGSEGGRDRFIENYREEMSDTAAITFHDCPLSESMRIPGRRIILLSDLDIYGVRREQADRYDRAHRRARARSQSGDRVHAWTDIQPGDYVVHVDHGIGKYMGLFEIQVHGQPREVLTIEYAEGAKLYVPTGQTHLLSRYIGVGKRRPELHALGGKRWIKEKIAAEKAVEDMAALLLETQAARDAKPGHAFSADTGWQHEFEGTFPFEETPDQERAIAEVKRDMESSRPMDRLICGDVGYGKTEVAMRASFKAVMDGKQVAVLVPTTVLAQQHYDSFAERMAAFPVRIESLSRFKTAAEQAGVLERLADGTVDIVIGTHRLVSKDVRFRDLGLVIIDEEQRFGVKHKEQLKRMRQLVDVLTMTATPIPRTLYMSLTGAKDLSIIETAPVERLPIETIVTEHRDDVVREAILRELNREGQVYFLHNRVGTIDQLHLKLAHLVPEARMRVAHGQMKEHELSAAMRAFTRGEFDVLLCTTIIESGLNIPNVNTIIIDRADRFGLSELYQLRGRVGRYKRKAFAYLLLPKHGKLFFMARQRIGAIKRYASLGSGFKLAMRDLEIRGAGNILGTEQSGHIAAVGFDLYCQLLQRTVATMKGEPVEPVIDVELVLDFIKVSAGDADTAQAAVIPGSYIEDENLRVRMYRRIAALARPGQVDEMERELADRFGRMPEPMMRLLLLTRIKLAAAEQGLSRIEVEEEKVIMVRQRDFVMTGGKFPRLPSGPATTRLEKLLALVVQLTSAAKRSSNAPAARARRD